MAIDTRKVIVGGVAAGAVMGAFDFVNGFLLAGQREAALSAFNPEVAAKITQLQGLEGISFNTFVSLIAFWVVSRLGLGTLFAWTYASMRPRYGAGPKTAALAAIPYWSLLTMINAAMAFAGIYPWSFFALGSALTAIEFTIEASVAGYFYAEA